VINLCEAPSSGVDNAVGLAIMAAQKFTDKNHYNPCFWTAHWNPAYLRAVKLNLARPDARKAVVNVLNVKANRIYQSPCKDVHFSKHLGIADITPEEMKKFVKRRFPNKYAAFEEYMKDHDYDVFMNFEEFFTGIEKLLPYQTLRRVIKTNMVAGAIDKSNLSTFIIWQNLRCHSVMSALLEQASKAGRTKFETFLEIRLMLQNTDIMYEKTLKLGLAEWKLYQVEQDTFPLGDSAISFTPENVMAALSPRHLLEIDLTTADLGCTHYNRISPEKLMEYRRRTIANAFKEIIFSDQNTLEEWRGDPLFQGRVKTVAEISSYDDFLKAEQKKGNDCLAWT
jgi:hypothetical protein